MTQYLGMNAITGRRIADLDHLRQSIGIINATPVGTRVMRRDFGGGLPDMVDAPLNEATQLQLKAAIVMGLNRWEPRLYISQIGLYFGDNPGQGTLEIAGVANVPGLGGATLALPLVTA